MYFWILAWVRPDRIFRSEVFPAPEHPMIASIRPPRAEPLMLRRMCFFFLGLEESGTENLTLFHSRRARPLEDDDLLGVDDPELSFSGTWRLETDRLELSLL